MPEWHAHTPLLSGALTRHAGSEDPHQRNHCDKPDYHDHVTPLIGGLLSDNLTTHVPADWVQPTQALDWEFTCAKEVPSEPLLYVYGMIHAEPNHDQ